MLSTLNVDEIPRSLRMGNCAYLFSTSPSPSAQCVAPSGCSVWVRRTDLNSASSPPRDWYLSPEATFGLAAVLCALPV